MANKVGLSAELIEISAKLVHDIATPLSGIQLSNKVLIQYLPLLLAHYRASQSGHESTLDIPPSHLAMLDNTPQNIAQLTQETHQLLQQYWQSVDALNTHITPPEPTPQATHRALSLDQRLTILVAEDNVMHRKIAEKLFAKKHDLDLVCNGQQAITQAKGKAYDLILLDLYMPILSGEEAVTSILEQGMGQPMIIACTNKPLGQEKPILLSMGFHGFLAKPLALEALQQLMTEG